MTAADYIDGRRRLLNTVREALDRAHGDRALAREIVHQRCLGDSPRGRRIRRAALTVAICEAESEISGERRD